MTNMKNNKYITIEKPKIIISQSEFDRNFDRMNQYAKEYDISSFDQIPPYIATGFRHEIIKR